MTEATQSAVADQAPLTIEQAVQRIQEQRASPVPEEEATEASAAPEQEIEEVSQASESEESEPETANAQDDDAEPAEPDRPAIEPPHFWDKEGKEAFSKLSPDAQREVVRYEQQRNAAVTRAQQQAAEIRRQYEAKHQQLQNLTDGLQDRISEREGRLEQWKAWFASDEAQLLARTDPGAFLEQQQLRDKEIQDHADLVTRKRQTEAEIFKRHLEEQTQLLPTIAPDLAANTAKGEQLRKDLLSFLMEEGYEPEDIRWIRARDMAIARDAMLYRKGLQLAKSTPAAAPKPKAGPTAAPTGQGMQVSSSQQRLKQLTGKSVLSIEEGIELNRLRRK
jgi:hypothetical protein